MPTARTMAVHKPRLGPLILWTAALFACWAASCQPSPTPVVLTNLLQVRSLTPELAAQGLPVRVVAVLGGTPWVTFLHDSTGSCYVPSDGLTNVPTGTKLLIEGVTAPGNFAPFIRAAGPQSEGTPHFQILGKGELPPPKQLRRVDLIDPSYDCERVELVGIVRSVIDHAPDDSLSILLRVGAGTISVGCTGRGPIPGLFPGAMLRVVGNLSVPFNNRRQQKPGGYIFSYAHDLRVESPGTEEPFRLRQTRIAELGQFSVEPLSRLHRIRGVVTAIQQGIGFFIEDDSGSTWIDHGGTGTLRTGEVLDVVGFRSIRRLVSSLDDNQIQKVGTNALPAPTLLGEEPGVLADFQAEAAQALDGRRIRFTARVTDTGSSPSTHIMVLGGISPKLTASLPRQLARPGFNLPQVGSLVELTGVYHLDISSALEFLGAELLLDSADGVRVVALPEPGTRHLRWVAQGSFVVAITLLVIAWFLHRKKLQLQREVSAGRSALIRQEELMRQVIDLIPGLLFVKDPDGRLLLLNRGLAELMGGPAHAFIGRTTTALCTDMPHLHDILTHREDKRDSEVESVAVEVNVHPAQGQDLWFHAIRRRMQTPNGTAVQLVLAIDITLLKLREAELDQARRTTEEASRARSAMEERLRQSQKMEAVGQLAGGVAHEFNNILAAMLLNLQTMPRKRLEPESQESLADVEGLAQRAAELVRQLLAFSRRSVMRVEPTDWRACVENQLRLLTRLLGARIHLEFHASDGLPHVRADRTTLEQVLMNLCLNARDAMPDGGRIDITLSASDVPAQETGDRPEIDPGRFLRLSVTDTGCGMDGATLERLFEPFFTTKEVGRGTGLGLATIRGLVQQQKGWVEVKSTVGVGSTFCVFLPAAEGREQPSPPSDSTPPASGGGTILLVEDEAIVRKATEKLLTRSGYTVHTATNASEALPIWNTHRDAIDLLYSDIVMPGERSGVQLALHLLAEKPGLRIILTSGYNNERPNLGSLDQGTISYVPKPCPPDRLLALVEQAITRRTPPAEGSA